MENSKIEQIEKAFSEISKIFPTKEITKKKKKLDNHIIQLKYSPFIDVPFGHRRCGQCGDVLKREVFKYKNKLAYDWRCPECNKFNGVYK